MSRKKKETHDTKLTKDLLIIASLEFFSSLSWSMPLKELQSEFRKYAVKVKLESGLIETI